MGEKPRRLISSQYLSRNSMKNYLSFGGGVNSVAMYLRLKILGWKFEAVFQDTGCEMPETYEYLEMFTKKYPVTILPPREYPKGSFGLYNHCLKYNMVPTPLVRWCTDQFKVRPIHAYVEKPCFMLIGIDAGESHRAKLSSNNGIEHRFPLIELCINRARCKEIIEEHNLPIPLKSGCFICPYRKKQQWKDLRMIHPDLFCKAETLERNSMEYRKSQGKKAMTLSGSGKLLKTIVDEKQSKLWKEDEFPPCECML
jgi:hypothetical protein